MIIEYHNNNTILLNNFLSLSCLVPCKTAPDVSPTKSPSLHAISLEQFTFFISIFQINHVKMGCCWIGTHSFNLYGYISLCQFYPSLDMTF